MFNFVSVVYSRTVSVSEGCGTVLRQHSTVLLEP